jgi:uncharacterized protein YgbK (DUF1537 family)
MNRLLALVMTLGLFAGIAHAHNGMHHVMGTVTAITDTQITVKRTDGKIQTVTVAAATKYIKGTTALMLKDVKVGDHVVIHASEKDEKLTAVEVKVGAMAMPGGMKGMKMDHPASTTPR